MRRSSTDESTYRRSPSPPGKEPGFARGGPFFGLHASPGPKAAQARYTSPKGNKYVVFYLDLSFIFLLELKRCSMARGCLQGVKYLMFAFNLLFWLGGCGILGVGIWLAATQGNFATLSSSFPSLSAANLLIATGAFVMAIGFVGCIGAIKENRCLLLTFFVALLLVFLLEACITILFFAYTDKIDRYAQQDLKKGLHLYGTPGNVGLTNAWSIIQTDVRRGMARAGKGVARAGRGPLRAQSQPASPAVPLLRGLQLHRLVRGLQRHACPRLLLPGVQRELRAARARHLVESAVLRDREDVAPGEPTGRGRLRAMHGAGADPGPDLRHDHVLPGGERGHLLCIAASCLPPRFAAKGCRPPRRRPCPRLPLLPDLSPARAWEPLGLPASAAPCPSRRGAGLRGGFWRPSFPSALQGSVSPPAPSGLGWEVRGSPLALVLETGLRLLPHTLQWGRGRLQACLIKCGQQSPSVYLGA